MARNILYEHTTGSGQIICIIQGDLTAEPVDAIINAANEQLAHGGGVAGAIGRKGGRVIQEESNRWVQEQGPVRTGGAAITGGGSLPAPYVIHVVGPVWGSGDEEAKLASAVNSGLELAAEYELRSLSLPAVSSGIFGFPKDLCARIIIQAVADFLETHPTGPVNVVNLCNIDSLTANIFLKEAQQRFAA